MADGGRDVRLREVRQEDPRKNYMTWEGSSHHQCTRERGACIMVKFSCGCSLQAMANGRKGSHRAWLISSEDGALQYAYSKQWESGDSIYPPEARKLQLLS